MTCLGVIVVCVRLSNYEIITMMAREKHILAGGEQDEGGARALLSSPKKERGSFFFRPHCSRSSPGGITHLVNSFCPSLDSTHALLSPIYHINTTPGVTVPPPTCISQSHCVSH